MSVGLSLDLKAQRRERSQRILKALQTTTLRMVCVDRSVRPALEDGRYKARERTLGAALDEDARTICVHPLDLSNPLDRRGYLLGQRLDDLLASILSGGVIATGHIGGDRASRSPNIQPLEDLLEGC